MLTNVHEYYAINRLTFHIKTRKDGKKTFEVDKDTQRRTKTTKMAKRCLKLTKTPKDRQRHAKTAKRYLKLTKTCKDGKGF